MLLPLLHNTVTAGHLWLADAVQCNVPRAPTIQIIPTTDPIQYDFTQSIKDLSSQKTQTVSPYPPGADTATGGLRVDRPEIKLEVHYGYAQYPQEQLSCLWYDNVKVTIALKPHIYVARDFGLGPCRDAILTHEQRHIEVDHEIVNQFSQSIGDAIKQAVDETGALGPYPLTEQDRIAQAMIAHVQAAVTSQSLLIEEEERKRQALVDSLEEYQRISAICRP